MAAINAVIFMTRLHNLYLVYLFRYYTWSMWLFLQIVINRRLWSSNNIVIPYFYSWLTLLLVDYFSTLANHYFVFSCLAFVCIFICIVIKNMTTQMHHLSYSSFVLYLNCYTGVRVSIASYSKSLWYLL